MSENEKFIPYGRQSIAGEDITAVVEVLQSDFLTGGPLVAEFEGAFAACVGSEYAIACSSGTAALHLAALALNLEEDYLAVIPTMTFLATANCVRYTHGEIVFADCDPNTGLLRLDDLATAIKSADKPPKLVIPVHMNGHSVELEAIHDIAEEYGMRVIEDACHALGTQYLAKDGTMHKIGACSFSDMTIFSLHPVKTITMGEGGVITTNKKDLYSKLIKLRNHGLTQNPSEFINKPLAYDSEDQINPWYYEMSDLGYNYRASDIHCALGISQLYKLDSFILRRSELVAHYNDLLGSFGDDISPVPAPAHSKSTLHLYVVHIDFDAVGVNRSTLMKRMREKGIGTQVHYLPVHLQPYYQHRYHQEDISNATEYYKKCLSLPLFHDMTGTDVQQVVKVLKQSINSGH